VVPSSGHACGQWWDEHLCTWDDPHFTALQGSTARRARSCQWRDVGTQATPSVTELLAENATLLRERDDRNAELASLRAERERQRAEIAALRADREQERAERAAESAALEDALQLEVAAHAKRRAKHDADVDMLCWNIQRERAQHAAHLWRPRAAGGGRET
jgi:chromosome segregation ATPase